MKRSSWNEGLHQTLNKSLLCSATTKGPAIAIGKNMNKIQENPSFLFQVSKLMGREKNKSVEQHVWIVALLGKAQCS